MDDRRCHEIYQRQPGTFRKGIYILSLLPCMALFQDAAKVSAENPASSQMLG